MTNTNDAPGGSVTITGTATQGQTLTADISAVTDADGLGTFSYQWKRTNDGTTTAISGATASTYTLVQADVGATIAVTVSWTDLGGTAESLTSDATSAVANVNDLPVASDFTKTTDEDTALTFAATDFTGAFSDPDGHDLQSVKLVTLPTAAHGALKVGTSDATVNQVVLAASLGTISFEPAANYSGSASFTYKATDSSGEESAAAATVTVTITAVDDLPVASGIEKTTDEDTALTFAATDFTGAFSDPDGPRPAVGEAHDAANGGAREAEGRHVGCGGQPGGPGGQPQHHLVRAGGELERFGQLHLQGDRHFGRGIRRVGDGYGHCERGERLAGRLGDDHGHRDAG